MTFDRLSSEFCLWNFSMSLLSFSLCSMLSLSLYALFLLLNFNSSPIGRTDSSLSDPLRAATSCLTCCPRGHLSAILSLSLSLSFSPLYSRILTHASLSGLESGTCTSSPSPLSLSLFLPIRLSLSLSLFLFLSLILPPNLWISYLALSLPLVI